MSTRFIVAAAAAAVVGFFSESPQAAAATFSLVYGATGFLDPAVHNFGPRLSDLSAPTANAGDPIPWCEGHPRKAFNIAYASDKHEIANTTEQEKGGPSVDNTTFTYEQDMLIILSETTGYVPRRIWDSGKLVWTAADESDPQSVADSQNNAAFCREIRSYTGEPTQLPDPDYEAAVGVGNAPAHRGVSSCWISGLNLGASGYPRILTIELGKPGDAGAFFEEDFDDELTPYTVVDGAGVVSIETSTYGPALKFEGGFVLSTDSDITRLIPPTPFSHASFKFQVLPVDGIPGYESIESAGFNNIKLGGGSNFRFVGNLGHAIVGNPYPGLPVLFNDLDSTPYPLHSQELQFNEWYTVDIEVVSGTAAVVKLILDDNGVVLTTTTVPFDDTSTLVARTLHFYNARSALGARIQPGGLYDKIQFGIAARSINEDAPLDQVVLRQCERSGLDSSQVNVTRLEGQFVRSMALSQLTPGRQTIETLAWAKLFGACEYGRTIEFFPFGAAAEGVISWDEFGASIDGSTADRLPETLINDIEQPATLIVTYADVDNDYQKGSQQDSRGITKSKIVSSNEVPLGLTATEAKRIAMVQMGRIAAGLLHVGPFTLSMAWAHVMPCDVWWLERADGSLIRAYIMKRTDSDDILTFEAIVDEASVIDAPIPVVTGGTSSYTVHRPTPTIWQPMDIAKLRQADDDAGLYGAATWGAGKGATVFKSQDGTSYAQAATHTQKAVLGHAVDALPDWNGLYQWDESSTLDVTLEDGELSSYTRDQVMTSTVGAMLIGGEIVQYRLATMTAALAYTLSGFLRVRRGTEWAGSGHATGERIVLLDASTLRRVSIEPGQLNIEQQYKAVTVGRSLAETGSQPFTDTGVALKPFSPVNLRVERTGSGTTVTWDRRTRDFYYWLAATPLGELTEAYEIDVVDADTETVLRTLTSTSEMVTYTKAKQIDDGVDDSTNLRMDVYQISAVVGRGYPGSILTSGGYGAQAQITEITLSGTFATGIVLSAVLGAATFSHTTVGGDTNLAGAATAFAAVIDASSNFTASAVGPVVTVTGLPGVAFSTTVGGSSGGVIGFNLVQIASDVSLGVRKEQALGMNMAGGGPFLIPAGTTITLNISNPVTGFSHNYPWTASGPVTDRYNAFTGIGGVFNDSGDVSYDIFVHTDGVQLFVETPTGESAWTIGASGGSAAGIVFSIGITRQAYPIVPVAQPQINDASIIGAPVTGNVYRVTLGGVDYDYTALIGDTNMGAIAAGLAPVVNAAAAYIAADTTSGGGVTGTIRITAAANNVPFTTDSAVLGVIVLTAALIQPAT